MGADTTWIAQSKGAHLPLDVRLAATDDHQLAATGDDVIGGLDGQIDAFLLDQTRDHGEQRAIGRLEVEFLADAGSVDRLAVPVGFMELLAQVRIAAGAPAIVDAIEQTGQLALTSLDLQQAFQPAAEFRGGDFLGIGMADGGDVVGVDQAGLEEGHLAPEFQTFHLEGVGGNIQVGHDRGREQALIRQVVDGGQAGGSGTLPAQVAGCKARLPVVEVQQIRHPANGGVAQGEIGSGAGKTTETDMVVSPVGAVQVAIGIARALVELRADQYIDDQPVVQIDATDVAGRHGSTGGDAADHLHPVLDRGHHLAITRDQYPNVMGGGEGAGQGAGYLAQAAGLDEVGNLRGNEKNTLAAFNNGAQRQLRLFNTLVRRAGSGGASGSFYGLQSPKFPHDGICHGALPMQQVRD